MAAERYDADQPVNLDTGEKIRIRELAKMISAVVGYSGEFVWDTTKPNGQSHCCLDVTRAQKEFCF